ncbi:asparagine synthase (glutamine-hydrolyzing) [Pleionea sediminis]|uniref:asparagine synthase (glutamine-hydrolyzing) n=1 Tax=Pleionea sediminis TaxID=2569479 RepID=UPI001185B2FE|nr:asparagine synthase (glutamine-hydrolyzing) [Pleionea sediminis]
MCGISFYYSQESSFKSEIRESLELIRHRGPDATGVYETKIENAFVGLGHSRLSIIELSDAGNQPMHDSRGYSIVFNGEVYNHRELRVELDRKEYPFVGSSDTEVILKLFIEHGTDSFKMLKGMYSFVILDSVKGCVHIVRDSIGIKPLYISKNKSSIFASSEIKGLKPYIKDSLEIDRNDVYAFFNTGFLYEPNTGFKDIKKLMPGSFMTIELASSNVVYNEIQPLAKYNNHQNFKEKLTNSVSNQLIADVPLGVFFSGGADSSILAGLAGDADLFFAEYASDPASNVDKEYSRKIAKHLDKKLVSYRFSDDESDIEQLIEQVKFVATKSEELVSDYTFWATYQLSEAARESGYKVMLSGMGGDEAFAGYPRYHVLNKHSLFKLATPLLKLILKLRIFPKSLDKKFERLVSYTQESNWGVAYSRLLGYFSRKELQQLFGKEEAEYFDVFSTSMNKLMAGFNGVSKNKVKMGQYLDRFGFLAHNLIVSDKASMLASIELRVPLLDESLVAHGIAEKADNLIDNKGTKKPLKELLSDFLPRNLIDRPKTGFNPPIDALVKKIGKERISSELLTSIDYIDSSFAKKLIDDHFSKKNNNAYKIWQLLYFKFWIQSQQ